MIMIGKGVFLLSGLSKGFRSYPKAVFLKSHSATAWSFLEGRTIKRMVFVSRI